MLFTSRLLLLSLVSKNKPQMKEDKIGWLSQQIEIDPLNKSHIIGRSEAFVLEGKYDEAISDYSKAILLQPSREYYVRRSKLLQDKGKFALAIQDLADARTLSKDSNQVTAADIYLETSVCMENVKEASQMAELVEEIKEKEDPKPYIQTLVELLHIQEMKLNEQTTLKAKQIEGLKAYYEQQSKSLKNFFICQLNELKLKINETVQNYQQKFATHLQSMELKQAQRQKMTVYFETFSSEAEKYYIAAKNLRKVEDKSLKFEDFQGIIVYKGRSEFMKKLYQFFDKYSSQIQKIVSVIQNIPYIGCAFSVIKATMKGKGWVDEANMQNQCINIEQVAINTTAFNETITNLAYYVAFYFQKSILARHPVYRSQWQLLLDRIKTIKREQLGMGKYKTSSNEELDAVKDYATIHASILMVGIACNCFTINKHILKQANQKELKPSNTSPQLNHIFKLIEQTQAILRKNDDTPTEKSQKGYCNIY